MTKFFLSGTMYTSSMGNRAALGLSIKYWNCLGTFERGFSNDFTTDSRDIVVIKMLGGSGKKCEYDCDDKTRGFKLVIIKLYLNFDVQVLDPIRSILCPSRMSECELYCYILLPTN